MVRIGSPLWRQCARRAAASWSAEGVLRLLKVLPSCWAILCESARAAILQPGLKEGRSFWCEWSDVRLGTLLGPLRVFTRIPQSDDLRLWRCGLCGVPPPRAISPKVFKTDTLGPDLGFGFSPRSDRTGYGMSPLIPTSIRTESVELVGDLYLACFLVVMRFGGLTRFWLHCERWHALIARCKAPHSLPCYEECVGHFVVDSLSEPVCYPALGP